MRNLCVSISILFLAAGCGASTGLVEESDILESTSNQSSSDSLVATMSLEQMFPDEAIRSLARAAGNGNIDQIDSLIDQGADVNATGTGNATPLFWALRSITGFERLLQLGADPNVVFDDKGTVIHWAVRHEDEDFLKLILNYGGDPNLVGTIRAETPLFIAVAAENKDKLPILLNSGAEIDAQSANGNTAIVVAAGFGQFDVVYQLLEAGANYNLENSYNGGNLLDRIAFRRRTIAPGSEGELWMNKVIDWFDMRGIQIPDWELQ